MKLIAIDMDGTLLNERREISEQNLAALQEAQEAGHVVMICSGRAKDDLEQVLKKYQLSVPFGASNGAVAYADGVLLQALHIQKDDAGKIASMLDAERIPYKLYTNQGIYAPQNWKEKVFAAYQTSNPADHGYSLEDLEHITEHQLKANVMNFFSDVHELLQTGNLEVEKFFILTLDPAQRSQLLEKLQLIPDIATTASAPTNLEVMHKDGNKGTGLRAMAKHLGIPMEDTVALGDNFNDVPMLKAAGLSIAMANAEQDVKDLCDAVTLTNIEHGVAYAIDQFVLNKAKQK